ncbi:MAG: trypsin-like peptidase domain-containing protein [Syntrophomonadaceae bacterium]|nr:trypsin-like peptidase domain-containing protein [Syntrophomonadaceae bacterium]
MKKSTMFTVLIVLLLGFWLGGSVVAYNTGTPLIEGIVGSDNARPAAAVTDDEPQAAAEGAALPTLGVSDIVEQAGPAVVTVEVEVPVSLFNYYFNDPFFEQFFGPNSRYQQPQEQQYSTGSGTGFLISADGYILTNQHVVNGAENIYVILNGSGERVAATLVGQDYELDLAILNIEGSGYPYLELGDSDASRVGDFVIAIGSPYSLDHTTTFGVISATGRPITVQDRSYSNLIQTDAAINPGNSGGPLLNMAGEVIAINTAVNSSAQGIGFAIPINTANEVLSELIATGGIERAFIGVQMRDLSTLTDSGFAQLGISKDAAGALVISVVDEGPAQAAGMQTYDVITRVNGAAVADGGEVQDAVAACRVGDTIPVEVLRGGKTVELSITLQSRPY